MKTLVFFGGARKKGNTMRMVNYLLENIKGEKEIIYCYDLKNSPCIDCRYCLKHNACSINDGMVEIYDKIEAADNIILAAPTYLYGAPGPMKTMLDRFQVYWAQVIRGDKPEIFVKKGAILVSGGGPRFENQFTGICLELADALHVCNVSEVGRVLMDDADRMENLEERPEIKEQLVKLADLLNK